MFNLKTALKGAAAGFILSFIAGIIGRVDFLILLLRTLLSAVFSGVLFGGLGVLYNLFLGGGSDIDLSPSVAKTSPSGSVVDITLADEELPDSDTAPDFAVSPEQRLWDEPAESKRREDAGEALAAPNAETAVPKKFSQPDDTSGGGANAFEAITLGKTGLGSFSGAPVSEFSASAGGGFESDAAEPKKTAVPASDTAASYSAEENVMHSDYGDSDAAAADISEEGIQGADGDESVIDSLPDMDGFSAVKAYAEDDNDDTLGDTTGQRPASGTAAGDIPVDISDAKNIADAIRTALKKES